MGYSSQMKHRGFPLTSGAQKSSACRNGKKFWRADDESRQFVMSVTQMSFDIRARVAQNIEQAGDIVQSFSEHNMPAYEICYLDEAGALTYKFSATCDDDQRAKILAHAMKLPSAKKLEVWAGEALIYTRPSTVLESHLLRAS
jgi:hypothetical protein